MISSKDFEMSPFEAARKLLSVEAQHLKLGTQSDLVFQYMHLIPPPIQQNSLFLFISAEQDGQRQGL